MWRKASFNIFSPFLLFFVMLLAELLKSEEEQTRLKISAAILAHLMLKSTERQLTPFSYSNTQFKCSSVTLRGCPYLIWRVFTGENPCPIGFHSEVPARRGTAVQVGPGDGGPTHVAKSVLLWKSGWSRVLDIVIKFCLVCTGVILWWVVLLR